MSYFTDRANNFAKLLHILFAIKEAPMNTMVIEDTNSTRIVLIKNTLEQKLQPRYIEVVDESHLHTGHAGARDGKGHFKLIVAAEKLDTKKPLEQHRIIYAALAELLLTDIHALSIEVRS
jgi:BolA family transcriptional regulator, general stress-responsive regulator